MLSILTRVSPSVLDLDKSFTTSFGFRQEFHHQFWIWTRVSPPVLDLGLDTLHLHCFALLLVLGPAFTGTGAFTLDPTFGSFTLLKPVSH